MIVLCSGYLSVVYIAVEAVKYVFMHFGAHRAITFFFILVIFLPLAHASHLASRRIAAHGDDEDTVFVSWLLFVTDCCSYAILYFEGRSMWPQPKVRDNRTLRRNAERELHNEQRRNAL